MEGASSRARSDHPSSDRTLRVAAFSRKGCDSETRRETVAQRARKGKKIGDARGRTRRIRPCNGGDVQCHFVPGVATPSVFDPQLPRSRGIPQSERTLATRSVPPRDQPRLTTPFVIERERNKRRVRSRSVTDR